MVSLFDDVTNTALWIDTLRVISIKGLVILMLAGLGAFVLRRASAAVRHFVWSVALIGVLLLPALVTLLPAWHVPFLSDGMAFLHPLTPTISNDYSPEKIGTPDVLSVSQVTADKELKTSANLPIVEDKRPSPQWHWTIWLFVIWLSGLIVVMGRFGIGLTRIWWITRHAHPATDRIWEDIMHRLSVSVGLSSPVSLLFSNQATMPLTWGISHPVVLLPSDAVNWSEERLHIVLIHELAHVKRRDCLTQFLAQTACAVYWFNPLVWLAARQQRIERERACDDRVLDIGANATQYADHLLDMARSFRSVQFSSFAAVAFARKSQLEGRLLSILDPHVPRQGISRLSAGFMGFGIACMLIPLASVQPSAQLQEATVPRAAKAPGAPAHLVPSAPPKAAKAPVSPERLESPVPPARPEKEDAVRTSATKGSKAKGKNKNRRTGRSYNHIESSAQKTEVQDELNINLTEWGRSVGKRIAPVIANAVNNAVLPLKEEAKAEALRQVGRLNQGRRGVFYGDYIDALAALGYEKVPVNQLIAMKNHGVTPAYIKQMHALGYEQISIDQAVSFRIHNITPAYIGQMRAVMDRSVPPDKLVSARIQGVSPHFIREMRPYFDRQISLKQFISFKIHGVNVALIQDLEQEGFTDLSAKTLISMKIHGVTPRFIQQIRDLGYSDLSLKNYTQFRIHGVSVAFIEQVKARGIKDLTAKELIALKKANININR